MFLLNGTPIQIDAPFTANDINYPPGWIRFSTPEARLAVGITEVPDPIRKDDRFYWIDEHNTATPKDLPQLKKQWIEQTKATAHSLLTPTDWMVLRAFEDNAAIPPAWHKYRDDVRAYSSQLETNIDSAKNIDVFIALVTNQNWPIDPDTQARIDAERKSTPRVG